ncbi:MAG: DNA polymerase I [Sphingomonadaceae bacterium]|jgi:DNA polymerase I|nr:DNA polymerase I [Sphingomonadaceae bacterium]NBU77587.1 DNA polymerase I [Sphingomonadaceae bacterium]NCA01753.1 DNA polymerase I [Sphingomonadaceae bacterium]
MGDQKHLYLVDGSGYIFRAYHRLPPLTNIRDEPVGAVYGYTTMLWKLADALHKADGPTHMAVILDASGKSFRNEIYDQYKAHRLPAPEDLVPQFPMIRDATRAFSLPCIEEIGLEADDIIASYAKAALAAGWLVTIVSTDKDLMQLIQPGLDMLDPMKSERLGPHAVVEKFGVGPEQLGEVLALMGDSADNVPGVPGIGPKTAAKLIQEFGTVEAVLAAAPEMKPSKMRDNLIAYADMARLSRILVTLKDDAALPEPLDDLLLKEIPEPPLRAFLEHHGFSSLLKKLGGESGRADHQTMQMIRAEAKGAAAAAPAAPEVQIFDREGYACVQSEAELDHWITEARLAGVIAVDTETDALDSIGAGLVGISLAVAPNRACYIPLAHGGSDLFSDAPQQVPLALAIAKLKPLLEDPSVLKIGHNIKYDLNVLARHNIHVAPVDDTMVLSFDLDAGLRNHGMDELALAHFEHSCLSFKDVCGSGKNQLTFNQVGLREATAYAAEDADVTLRLWHRLKPRLHAAQTTRVYERVDRPLIPVLAQMERHGIKVDRDELARMSSEFAEGCAGLEVEIHALAGSPFAVGSPKQLGEVLFGKMGLKGGKKGKSGDYSTDVTVLEKLAEEGVEIARKVVDWRQLSKLRSTYTDALQQQINPRTGRVHTSYSLTGAQTGRLSSNDPNLQNIPIRTETGRRIRQAFVAEPGNVLLSADYSQIELRLAAHMADVPALKDAFAKGEDIHARTAHELFGEVNRDTRGRAKTINFSLLYGISRWGLAARLGISADEAQAMIDRYFERFPGINRYISRTLQQARETGYTETLFGRKTHFPRLTSQNQTERAGSERAAINAPIQGTSADIIKRAMVRMGPALAEAGLPHVRMLLQVHDELVFELPENDVAAAKPVIERVMAEAAEPLVKLDVPLGVEMGTGKNWGDAH